MGYLVYDNSCRVSFDDRVLAHLQVAVVSKLRRKESFLVRYLESPETGGGHICLWFDASLPLRFHFQGSLPPAIEPEWVERLVASAASSAGLMVADEYGEPAEGVTHERRSGLHRGFSSTAEN